MKLILIFSVLFLLACATESEKLREEFSPENTSCVDTGDSVECESHHKNELHKAAEKEVLNFSGDER